MTDQFSWSAQRSRFDSMVKLSKVLDVVFMTAMVAAGLISFNVVQDGLNKSSVSVLVLFLATIGLFLFYRKGYSRTAGTGLIIAISGVVTYNLVVAGGIHDNATIIFPVLITIGGLVLGKRFIPYLTGLMLVEMSLIYWLISTNKIFPFGGRISVYFHSYLTVMFLLLISGIVIWITVDTLEKNFLRIIDSESEIRKSYDHLLNGWGKALELFDRETEGHSNRVSDLALQLAQKVGVAEADLVHIRRGALLHDIGKMGVSEVLLSKPESLTRQERREVEKHPLNAHKLLKDIPYLAQAMEIPVYHHERWDGAGYPFRLSGDEIPISARIFALVDNWDALRSDRPYRKAWPKDKVLDYFRNQSGLKFDPDLIEPFLSLVE